MKIKLYGERNSCNNYMIKLLDTNTEVESVWDMHTKAIYGWTHGEPIPCDEANHLGINFIIMVKNPYSWLLSLHTTPHKTRFLRNKIKRKTFYDFLSTPFDFFRNPILLYNKRIAVYLTFAKFVKRCILIRSEDLIADSQKELDRVIKQFELKKSEHYYTDYLMRINSGGKTTTTIFDRKFYLEEHWRERFRSKHIELINKYLNWTNFEKLDYERL